MVSKSDLNEKLIKDAECIFCKVCQLYKKEPKKVLSCKKRDDDTQKVKGLYITFMVNEKKFSYAAIGKILSRDKRTIIYSYNNYNYHVQRKLKEEYDNLIQTL